MPGAAGGVLPLLLGTVGLLLLYGLVRRVLRLRGGHSLQGSVVAITGASSGLGRECARVFHAAGARLILCGRDQGRLQEVVQELTYTRGRGQTHPPSCVTFDLSKAGAVTAGAAEVLGCYGHVDVLLNNAGVSYRGNILDTHISIQRAVMETNYFGPIALTEALLPSMVARGRGHVVVISSIQGRISIPYRSAYAASKHATQAYFDCLRAEVEQHGLEVTVVSPGYINTSLSLNALTGDGSTYGVLDQSTAEGRAPGEVARVVLEAVCLRTREVVMAGAQPTLALYLRTFWPSLFFRIMASRARKQQKPKDH